MDVEDLLAAAGVASLLRQGLDHYLLRPLGQHCQQEVFAAGLHWLGNYCLTSFVYFFIYFFLLLDLYCFVLIILNVDGFIIDYDFIIAILPMLRIIMLDINDGFDGLTRE